MYVVKTKCLSGMKRSNKKCFVCYAGNGEEDGVIQVLLAAGADINETADSGVSCIELAKMKGYSGLAF